MFIIGDALRYGERRWGETYAQVMDATGMAYQTLANAKWVASRVPVQRRRTELSWSHHAEVASLEATSAAANFRSIPEYRPAEGLPDS